MIINCVIIDHDDAHFQYWVDVELFIVFYRLVAGTQNQIEMLTLCPQTSISSTLDLRAFYLVLTVITIQVLKSIIIIMTKILKGSKMSSTLRFYVIFSLLVLQVLKTMQIQQRNQCAISYPQVYLF